MTDEEQRRRHEELLLLLLLLLASTKDKLAALAAAYAAGKITSGGFGDQAEEVLASATVAAVALGRRLGGVPGEQPTADDAAFADALMVATAAFLAKFVADLDAGRYVDDATGEESETAIAARAALYGAGLYHAATAAWIHTQPDGTRFDWHLNSQNPCNDCPGFEADGPYTADELPGGGPGGGASECATNCRCFLTTADGEQSFFEPAG